MALAIPGTKKVSTLLRETGNLTGVGLEAVRKIGSRPWPVAEFLEQCWFIAKVTTVPVMLVTVPFGMVLSLLTGTLIAQLGADAQIGAILGLASVREQAPLAASLLIAGAAGSAICADIGARNIRDEISALQVMGINPIQRLVMPRVVACTLMSIGLLSVTMVAGLASGMFFAIVTFDTTLSSLLGSFNTLIQTADIITALAKGATFGFIAGTVACYKGLYCKTGPKGVGEAVNQSVVVTFVLLFFVNFVITTIYFNFVPQKFS